MSIITPHKIPQSSCSLINIGVQASENAPLGLPCYTSG